MKLVYSNIMNPNSNSDSSDEENRQWIRKHDGFNSGRNYPRLRNVCSYIFQKGKRRGERCLKRTVTSDGVCAMHKPKPRGDHKKVSHARKIKFMRLKKHLSYLLLRIVGCDQPIVELWNEEKIQVRLPRSLKPVPAPLTHCLMFSSNEGKFTAYWKKISDI